MNLASIVFDCRDAATVARFWAGALECPIGEDASPAYAVVSSNPAWMFLAVPEAKVVKNRVHVDLEAADLEAEVERLVALGATRLADHDEGGTRWVTLSDVEGNEFDVASGA
jgi:predicted enzyme related to lactoylglutathione lyase